MNNFMGILEDEIEKEQRLRNTGPPEGGHERRIRHEHGGQHLRTEDRPITLAKMIKVATGAVGVVTTLGLGIFFTNPFEMAAKAQEAHAAINKRVDALETAQSETRRDIAAILTAGKETQELQLQDRVQQLADKMAKYAPGSESYNDARQQRNEFEQRLAKLRRELGR